MDTNDSSSKWPHTGAVFCGGKSSRFGGTPKSLARHKSGITLIEYVYQTLKTVCRDVVFVGKPDNVPAVLHSVTLIQDEEKNKGPLAGLQALLHSQIDTEYLIAPCDLSEATEDLFRLLTMGNVHSPAILMHEKEGETLFEPLIGRYSTEALPVIEEHLKTGRLALHQLIPNLNPQRIPVPPELSYALKNVNTQHDLK